MRHLCYFALLSFKNAVTYKVQVYFTLLGSILSLSVQVFIWRTLYAGNIGNFEIALPGMVTYLILSIGLSTFLMDASVQGSIKADVRTGNIATYLVKPINYMATQFAKYIGRQLYSFLFIVLPVFCFAVLLYGFVLPHSFLCLVLALIVAVNSVFIYFCLFYAIGLISFWLLDQNGMVPFIVNNFTKILAGAVVPLWYFPSWLKQVALILPFRFGFDIPISIYLGKIPLQEIGRYIGIELIWMIVLWGICRIMWGRAIKKVVIQGG